VRGYFKVAITGIILAGGESRRIGKNKALLQIGGKRIIERILELFTDIFGQVIIVTNSPHEFQFLDVRIVTDIFPKMGCLGGIYTGLFFCPTEKAMVVACDMPFLNKKLIEYLISLCEGYDIVIPQIQEFYEPLHAIYSINCAPFIEKDLIKKEKKIINFFTHLKVRKVSITEIQKIDPERKSFININTEEDYNKYRDFAS
jgi:molybdopterin-guanine dinucleotide biosynthesis protein A